MTHTNGNSDCFEVYTRGAATFKNTLRKLEVTDRLHENGRKDSALYDLMSEKLNDFPQLEDLKIAYHTRKRNRLLLEFDGMIESCGGLKSVYFNLYPQPRRNARQETLIVTDREITDAASNDFSYDQPLKDINTLELFGGKYVLLDYDHSFRYIMHKFSKLFRLDLVFRAANPSQPSAIPVNTNIMKEFSIYVVNTSFLNVKMPFMILDDSMESWINKFLQAKFEIQYSGKNRSNTITFAHQYQLSSTSFIQLTLAPPSRNTTELLQFTLVERLGPVIQQLEISNLNIARHSNYDNYHVHSHIHCNWIDHILRNCRVLKQLIISRPGRIYLAGSNMIRNKSIEKLVINNIDTANNVNMGLSIRILSLKYLCLDYENLKNNVLIYIPCTYLDTLTLCSSIETEKDGRKYYTRLDTSTTVRYYMGDIHGHWLATEDDYYTVFKGSQTLLFDIKCNSIKLFSKRSMDMTYIK